MGSVGRVKAITINGVRMLAKPGFSANAGRPLRTAVVGDDGVHGYTETAQVAFLEGSVTITEDIDIEAVLETTGATVVAEFGGSLRFIYRDANFAGEGTYSSDEGELAFRMEAKKCDIVR